jgi:hypothetical protein
MLIRLVISVTLLFLLSGCTGTRVLVLDSNTTSKINRPIYLRGVFNFWDIDDGYRAHPVLGRNNLWRANVNLVADGKPYAWQFGDSAWRCGSSFGVKSGSSDIEVNQPRVADPCSGFRAYEFTPRQDGTYDFFLDWSQSSPQVYIEFISE